MTGGKIAYLHMPDTGLGGFTSFNRYFFAQIDKHGVIIDERYNLAALLPITSSNTSAAVHSPRLRREKAKTSSIRRRPSSVPRS
jgi:hypothetical protein